MPLTRKPKCIFTEGSTDCIDPHYQDDWTKWSKTYTDVLNNWCRSAVAWNVATDEHGKPNIGPYPCGGILIINTQKFCEPLSERPGQLRPAPVKSQANRSTLPICLECLRGGGRLGTTAALNQDRTAIYHNGLPGAESFLHQKQIGLRYVMSLADSANRETLSHAFV